MTETDDTPVANIRCALFKSPSGDRAILDGPPKCGKTSLLFDVACALASSGSCRGGCPGPCRCIRVTLFKSTGVEEFPLRCREPENSEGWSEDALRRIEIRYVTSVKEIVEYMLAIQGLIPKDQPSAGIMIDDFDSIASRCDNQTKIMILSLVINGALQLQRKTGARPTILVTTSLKHHLPSFPTRIEISKRKYKRALDSRAMNDEKPKEITVGRWRAESRVLMSAGVSRSLEYTMIELIGSESLIRWNYVGGDQE